MLTIEIDQGRFHFHLHIGWAWWSRYYANLDGEGFTRFWRIVEGGPFALEVRW